MSDRGYHRLPIYQDHEPRRTYDLGSRSRPTATSMLDEMRRHMGDDWGSDPFSSSRTYRVRPFGSRLGFDDDLDSLCKDFFELKPRNPLIHSNLSSGGGSRESLDEDTAYKSTDEGRGRKFQVSFEVKDYEPQDISVKVDRDTLIVEAKKQVNKDGVQSTKQFNRSFHLPKDVDSDKLISSLSSDGILTIEAPVPPNYSSLPSASRQSQIQSSQAYIPPKTYTTMPPPMSAYNPPPASSVYSQTSSSFPQPRPIPTTRIQESVVPGADLPPPPAYPGHSTQYQAPQSQAAAAPGPGAPPPQPSYPAPAAPPAKGPAPAPQQPPVPQQQASPADSVAVDTPVFTAIDGGKRLDLVVDIGKPYTADDILVKLEGKQLLVEAEHVEKAGSKKSKSCMSREFDLEEDIDPRTVQANFDDNGRLIIAAMVLVKAENSQPNGATAQPQS